MYNLLPACLALRVFRTNNPRSSTSCSFDQSNNGRYLRQPSTVTRIYLLNRPGSSGFLAHSIKHLLLEPEVHPLILLAHEIRAGHQTALPSHRIDRRREGRDGLRLELRNPWLGDVRRDIVEEDAFGVSDEQESRTFRLPWQSANASQTLPTKTHKQYTAAQLTSGTR